MKESGPHFTIRDERERTETKTVHYTEVQDGEMDRIRERALRHVLGYTSDGRQLSDSQLVWVHTISTTNPDALFPTFAHKLIEGPEGELLYEVFGVDGGLQAIITPNPDAADAFNLDLNSPTERAA